MHSFVVKDSLCRGSFREAGLLQVTCILRERQLRLYGHEARHTAEDAAIGFCLIGIRGAGTYKGAARVLRGKVRSWMMDWA